MAAEREADASNREVEARVNVALVVARNVHIVVNVAGVAAEVWQAGIVGAECVNKVLAAEEEVVTVAVEVAFTDCTVKHVRIVVVGVVRRSCKLNCKY